MPATRQRRPPPHFVPITQPRWDALCQRIGANRFLRDLEHEGRPLGWRKVKLYLVDPDGYRAVVGEWPPGYWPG